MCDVHLDEETSQIRVAPRSLLCGSCRRTIEAGASYRHVVGSLDDGSPGRWRYQAHEDCYLGDYQDVSDDGCFTWVGAEPMSECPQCGSDDVRRTTETDLVCIFCGHEWLDPLPPDTQEPDEPDDA